MAMTISSLATPAGPSSDLHLTLREVPRGGKAEGALRPSLCLLRRQEPKRHLFVVGSLLDKDKKIQNEKELTRLASANKGCYFLFVWLVVGGGWYDRKVVVRGTPPTMLDVS